MLKADQRSCGLFWLVVVGLTAAMTSTATPKITAETPVSWLEPVISNDPRFSAILQRQSPVTSLPALQGLLPYSIAVVNKGNVPIVAIAIRFKVITGGKTIIRDYFYHAFRTADVPVLAPAETRLFAPGSAANDLLHGRPSQPRSMAAIDSDVQLLSAAEVIHVSIDLAISRDQRIAGADEGKHVAQVLGQAQALHDMAAEFVARSGAGATDAELKTWLSGLAKSDNQTSDRYEVTKRSIAAAWFGALASGKRADLEPVVAKTATLPDKTREFLTSLKEGLQ